MSLSPAERSLQVVLVTDLLFQVVLWGVPSLLQMNVLGLLANFWNVPLPDDPIFIRLLGAFSLGWAFVLFTTLKDPTAANGGLLKASVVTHTLVAAAIVYALFSGGVTGFFARPTETTVFWWITVFLNLAFALGILFAAPRPTDRRVSTRHAVMSGGGAKPPPLIP